MRAALSVLRCALCVRVGTPRCRSDESRITNLESRISNLESRISIRRRHPREGGDRNTDWLTISRGVDPQLGAGACNVQGCMRNTSPAAPVSSMTRSCTPSIVAPSVMKRCTRSGGSASRDQSARSQGYAAASSSRMCAECPSAALAGPPLTRPAIPLSSEPPHDCRQSNVAVSDRTHRMRFKGAAACRTVRTPAKPALWTTHAKYGRMGGTPHIGRPRMMPDAAATARGHVAGLHGRISPGRCAAARERIRIS